MRLVDGRESQTHSDEEDLSPIKNMADEVIANNETLEAFYGQLDGLAEKLKLVQPSAEF